MDERDKFWSDFLDEYGSIRLSDLIDDEDSLTHYGRKGMKWYQHIFTKAQELGSRVKSKIGEKKSQKEAKRAEKAAKYRNKEKRIPLKKMSNEELQARIDRLRKEEEYVRLSKATRNRGLNLAIDILEGAAKRSLTDALSDVATKKVKNMFNESNSKQNKNKSKQNKETTNDNNDKRLSSEQLNKLVKELKTDRGSSAVSSNKKVKKLIKAQEKKRKELVKERKRGIKRLR